MNNVSSYCTDRKLEEVPVANLFEELYISIRKKEGRIYTNEEVSLLPHIDPGHIHYKEWQVRRRSCGMLITYLRSKKRSLKILEVGCGNGWLSAKLSAVNNSKITGIDRNLPELKQAREVFGHEKNLVFIYGGIHDKLALGLFDIIVFAASIQYFSSLRETVNIALSLLDPGGEIHIIDTHFYEDEAVADAIKRTKNYYTGLGHSEMAQHYFHHTMNEIKTFKCRTLFKGNIINKLLGKRDPFPWIQIIK